MADDTQLAEATQPLSFAEFLERMKEPAAADLVRSIKNFIKTFEDRKPDPERDSVFVQSFLTKSEAAFKQHPVWASAPPAHKAQAVEGLEKYLMTKIYHKTFATSELDRERDEALHVRMRALNFIKPSHLDIPELFRDEKAWILAMKELHKINNYKAPRDKLVCILNCCRVINNLLHVQVQHGEARGADDFLPVLIYVVIHANPPQLASNLEYIQRFRMVSRMASESAYFFTQLYSAASFIETVNANSLSMDPDEFMARMIAAGVPDMQLAPSQDGATKPVPHPEKPPAFVTAQPTLDSAANHWPPEDAADPTPDQPPTGAALPTSAVPLQAELAAGTVLPTHSAPLAGRQAVVPDAATMLPDAGPAQYVAPAVPSTGVSALAAEASANPHMAGDDPMRFQGRYPTVDELEKAGVSLVLEAEAAGYLKQHYRFLYAAAGDLLVTDVPELLALYKELALRYESLSRAVAQVASQSTALAAAAQLPVGTEHASTSSMLVPQTAFAQPTTAFTESLPQHAAKVPLSSLPLESAATPATALALEEASETAEDAAEKVLKPTTSAGLYDDRLNLHDKAASGIPAAPASAASGDALAPPAASAHSEEAGGVPEARSMEAEFVQAMALQDDDRFLSLATGEAQADALDVGTPEAGAPPGAFSPASVAAEPVHLPTVQEVNDPLAGQDAIGAAAPPPHASIEEDLSKTADIPSSSNGLKDDSEEQPREVPKRGTDAQEDGAGGAPEHAGSVGDALEDFARRPAGDHALDPSRLSISSTAATVGDRTSMDVSRIDGSWSQGKSDAETSSTAAAESTDSAGGAADPAVLGAATEQLAQSAGFEAGVPATSSDADPFYATDLALKVSAAQEEKQDLQGPKTPAEMLPMGEDNKHAGDAAADDLFGGLNVAPVPAQEHVPASTSLI
ncbi:probable vacuolar protein sorting-associated protein 9A at N-terminal half [Coccomyxa sp. Obi]|nr:probable vacuolar protein sorting-associated protein 9A at N-terminal half [Coccomyxa sp. Obi]